MLGVILMLRWMLHALARTLPTFRITLLQSEGAEVVSAPWTELLV